MDEYLNCLEKESRMIGRAKIETVYIGGGTPTYFTSKQLNRLADIIKSNFDLSSAVEYTIEANPEGLDKNKLQLIKSAGINRISLGIQSLNDKYLKYLGRCHDSTAALGAYDLIREAGFQNVSLDLMFSFPGQTRDELEQDLTAITGLGSEHVSLYSLTVEENSRFFAQKVSLPENHRQAEFYQRIVQELPQRQFYQYEISNFARKGFESKHNINYWRGGDYIGLGVGAHSHEGGVRSVNDTKLISYMKSIASGKRPNEVLERLTPQQRFIESILLGLRMSEGVNIEELERFYHCRLDEPRRNLLTEFAEEGLLIYEKENIRTTLKGMSVLDEISARLF